MAPSLSLQLALGSVCSVRTPWWWRHEEEEEEERCSLHGQPEARDPQPLYKKLGMDIAMLATAVL